jgi:hypothetical protein
MKQPLEWIKDRNTAYAGMSSRKDMMMYHRNWFASFLPVKASKNDVAITQVDKKPKYIFNHASCKPKPILFEHLQLFVDMHDNGFLPLEWQFGCSKKMRCGKVRERRSYISGLMDRTQAERLDYALCGHSQLEMFTSDLPTDVANMGESKDPATIIKSVSEWKDEEMGRGAELTVERYGAARCSQSFPSWSLYAKLAAFLEDKNPRLCCDIFKHTVMVHIVDKQWFKASPMYSALHRILMDLQDVRFREKIDKGLNEEEKDHEKLMICNRIYSLNPNQYSLISLHAKPIEDLNMMYLDMRHSQDRASGAPSSVSAAIQSLTSVNTSVSVNTNVGVASLNVGPLPSQQSSEPLILENRPIGQLEL